MSNHSGSHMLNKVLKTLDQYSVYDFLGHDKTQELVGAILKISWQYDCNPGEILDDGIGERLGVCRYCQRPADEFQDGVCLRCHAEYFSP